LRIQVRFVEPSREGSDLMLSPPHEYKNPGWAALPRVQVESHLIEGSSLACYFEFDSRHRILRCRLEGDVTDASLKECCKAAGRYAALTTPSSPW